MEKIKLTKKILLSIFTGAIFFASSFFALGFSIPSEGSTSFSTDVEMTNSGGGILKQNSRAAKNPAVYYQSQSALGSFIDGYVYQFTDSTKFESYRQGNSTSEITSVVVDSTATHGSQNNPYVLSQPEDWEKLVKLCGVSGSGSSDYFVLANDIDFSGTGVIPVTTFNSTFYGNGYTLKNMTISSSNWVYWEEASSSWKAMTKSTATCGLGLFCKTAAVTIADLNIDNFTYEGAPDLFGQLGASAGPYYGGLIGNSTGGTTAILNTHINGSLGSGVTYTKSTNVAGLVGYIHSGSMKVYRTSVDAQINETISGVLNTSGMFGSIQAAVNLNVYDCVSNLVANANISADTIYFGSLSCYSGGKVSVENYIGKAHLTLNRASYKNFTGAIMVGDSRSSTSLKNVFADGKVGTSGNLKSMHALTGSNVNASTLNTSYIVKETTDFATVGSVQSFDPTSDRICSSNQELINKAKEVLTNSNIWDTSKFGDYGTASNPVSSANMNKHIINTAYRTQYNGEKVEFEKLFPGMSVATSDNCIDAGSHSLEVTLNDENLLFYNLPEDTRTATVTLTIEKAPLSISTLQVDEFGKLIGLGENQTVSEFLTQALSSGQIYQHDIDSGIAPEFVLLYQKTGGSWTETLPTTAGTWYVKAGIKNATDCNYILENDGQTAFNRAKDYVALPYFSNSEVDKTTDVVGTTTTISYNGQNQVFSLINDSTNDTLAGISIGERSAGLLYSSVTGKFSVTGVGTYTVEVSLADPANNQWADRTSGSKTITLVVKPAELVVTIDDASKTSWEKGERGFKVLIYVDGIIDNDPVKIDASYGIVGENDIQYIPENNMVVDADKGRMTITLDTTNLSINKTYSLTIALKDNVAANKNYVLINETGDWEFIMTTSKIKQEDIKEIWCYSNLLAGSGNFDSTESGSVEYNEAEYTVGLSKEGLPAGVEVTYSGDFKKTDSENSKVYIVTAVLSAKEGYSFEYDVQTTYTFNWTISPLECDLSALIWMQDFEYNGKNQTMKILNLPGWLSDANYEGNVGRNANSYQATYTAYLTQHGNHTFTNKTNAPNIEIKPDGRSAVITHDWVIKKAVIQVSNSADLWLIQTILNNDNEPVDLRVPTAMTNFGAQLILKYYKNQACTEEIDPVEMKLVKEDDGVTTTPTPYFAKVELNPEFSSNYEIQNVTQSGVNYAILKFNVGGRREILHLTVDESLVYNGQAQNVSIISDIDEYNDLVTAGKAGYSVKYYAVVDDAGNYGSTEVEPKHVGRYVAVIFVQDLDDSDSNDIVNEYIVYCHAHYFEIIQLKLTTNWSYTPNGASAIPEENVTGNGNFDVSDFYTYSIYDGTGTNNIGSKDNFSLNFNTRYIARLAVKDTSTNDDGVANVVIVDANDDVTFTNVTEFAFTTGTNPDSLTVVLDNPEIVGPSSIVFDKNDHKVDIRIKDDLTGNYLEGADLLNYVDISLKNDSGVLALDGTDIMTQFNAGEYTYVIKLKTGANASWLWGEATDEKEVTFTIEKKAIILPSLKNEYEWTGSQINIWVEDESWLDYVDNDVLGTIFATELGDYSAKFVLADKVNTYWDDRALIDAGKGTDDIDVNWSIVKAKITGSWNKNDKGIPVFVADDEDKNQYFEVKYLDESGKEVSMDKLSEGGKYTAVVSVKDAEHFEFFAENEAYQELRVEFTYQKPLGFLDKAWNFVKKNWLWFAIGGGILLLLLLLLIIIAAIRRRKKKEKPAEQLKEDKKEDKKEENKEEKKELEEQKQSEETKSQDNASSQPQSSNNAAQGVAAQTQPYQAANFAQQPYINQPNGFNQPFVGQANFNNQNPYLGYSQSNFVNPNFGQNNMPQTSGLRNEDFEKIMMMLEVAYAGQRKRLIEELGLLKEAKEKNEADEIKALPEKIEDKSILSQYEEKMKKLEEVRNKRKQLELSRDKQKLEELKERRKILEVNQELLKRKIAKKLDDKKGE